MRPRKLVWGALQNGSTTITSEEFFLVALVFWFAYERTAEIIIGPSCKIIYDWVFPTPKQSSPFKKTDDNIRELDETIDNYFRGLTGFIDQSTKLLNKLKKIPANQTINIQSLLDKLSTLKSKYHERISTGRLKKLFYVGVAFKEEHSDLEKANHLKITKWVTTRFDDIKTKIDELEINAILTEIKALTGITGISEYAKFKESRDNIFKLEKELNYFEQDIMKGLIVDICEVKPTSNRFETIKRGLVYGIALVVGGAFYSAGFQFLGILGITTGIFDMLLTALIFASGPDILHQTYGSSSRSKNKVMNETEKT